jgi:hypothetical protein
MKYRMILLGACALIASAGSAQVTTAPAVAPVQAAAPVAAAPVSATLAAGAAVVLTMDKSLATDKLDRIKGEPKPAKGHNHVSNPGDIFTMTVAQDVKSGDVVVIPKGSRATGEVVSVTNRGGFGKSGKIDIKINSVEVGASRYALVGTHLQRGKGRGGAAVAGTIIAGVIAGAFIKGDEADIPLSTELTFHTKDAITVTR